MDNVNLVYKLEGPGVEEGIDIFELSPILLSYGELIRESYKTLYPNNPDIAISVKPFEKGSFVVDISLFAKQWFDWTKTTQAQDLKTALEWLGMVKGYIVGGTVGLIALIKFLNGKAKSVEQVKPGEFKYTGENNIEITVKKETHILYQNCNIQQTINKCVARPLELEGIDDIQSYIKQDENISKVKYDKEFVVPIKNYSNHPIPSTEKEETIENERLLWVQPKRGSYEGEKNSWSFRIGEDEVFTATMADDSFRDKIRESKIRLAPSDRMLVKISEKQHVKGTDISISREITEVINYIRGPEQEELEFKEK